MNSFPEEKPWQGQPLPGVHREHQQSVMLIAHPVWWEQHLFYLPAPETLVLASAPSATQPQLEEHPSCLTCPSKLPRLSITSKGWRAVIRSRILRRNRFTLESCGGNERIVIWWRLHKIEPQSVIIHWYNSLALTDKPQHWKMSITREWLRMGPRELLRCCPKCSVHVTLF